jgi:hypothetical protein
MNEETQKILARIQSLVKQKEEIEKEIEKLLSPKKVVARPPSFSLKDEVLSVIKNTGSEGVSSQGVLHSLQQKYPDYEIQGDQVASTLAYLKNTKKDIEKAGKLYRIKGVEDATNKHVETE